MTGALKKYENKNIEKIPAHIYSHHIQLMEVVLVRPSLHKAGQLITVFP
jgi:hypothetical protein